MRQYSAHRWIFDVDKTIGQIAPGNTPGAPDNEPPVAAFTFASLFLETVFDASTSSDPDGTIVSYVWDFGDSNSGTGVNPTHTYALAGTYTVQLTVTDDAGATDTESHSVTVGTGTARTTTPGAWESVDWSPTLNLFVAVSSTVIGASQRVMTSPDGITWTTGTAPTFGWSTVLWVPELALFVAVSRATTTTVNRVMTSPDGFAWTQRTVPTSAQNLRLLDMAWSPSLGRLVAVGQNGGVTNGGNDVVYSPDGINWTQAASVAAGGVNPTLASVRWSAAESQFVAGTNSAPGRIRTSPDGITWTTTGASVDTVLALAYSPALDRWFAAGQTSTVGYTSPDGSTWTNQTLPSGAASAWGEAEWLSAQGKFMIVGAAGSGPIMTSPTGLTGSFTTDPGGLTTWQSFAYSPSLNRIALVGNAATRTIP